MPEEDVAFGRYLDSRVAYAPDSQELATPQDLKLSALDRTSIRAQWTAAGGYTRNGFEVRWGDHVRLVQNTEVELTDLDPEATTDVEVRALDPLGKRSEPARASGVPNRLAEPHRLDGLVQPVDVFDGPSGLDPQRWRLHGNADCVGLRPFNGKRVEVTCEELELQANTPLQLTDKPDKDGAFGRVVFTTDGPAGADDGEFLIVLLPEPYQDLGKLAAPFPTGSIVLHVTRQGASFDVGEGALPNSGVVNINSSVAPPTPGVRHRWEVRILDDTVVALRDGEALATSSVEIPWKTARPRLVFRNARGTTLDSFGVAGTPQSPQRSSVVPLGPGTQDHNAAVLKSPPRDLVAGGTSVRVVATVVAEKTPVTIKYDDRSATATFLSPASEVDQGRNAVVYADFPVTGGEGRISVSGEAGVTVYDSHLVVTDGPDAHRPLPKLADQGTPEPRTPQPSLTVVQDQGKTRIAVELDGRSERELAAIKGVELDLDGTKVAAVPTNGSAGGRHEFVLDDLAAGAHRITARVLPVDQRVGVRTEEQSFDTPPR
ncbi:fibronectin type III domain-containing protein [Actinosynnema sp. NPDC020468]|uniref:fibronectin type III domain-containing protein n=1 Tax=Actinosynnema sp. NPDC020468 TaxID=3154488 RepID=UPI0033EEFC7E